MKTNGRLEPCDVTTAYNMTMQVSGREERFGLANRSWRKWQQGSCLSKRSPVVQPWRSSYLNRNRPCLRRCASPATNFWSCPAALSFTLLKLSVDVVSCMASSTAIFDISADCSTSKLTVLCHLAHALPWVCGQRFTDDANKPFKANPASSNYDRLDRSWSSLLVALQDIMNRF